MATYYSRPCDKCGIRELTESRTGPFLCYRCEGTMKHRCNGCGSLYNGRACGICQSAADAEPEEFDEFAPVPVRPSSGAPTWFVAVLFFVVGMMFAAALIFAASPRR